MGSESLMSNPVRQTCNVSTLLDANLTAGRGEKAALLCGDEQVTYAQLYGRACAGGAGEPGVRGLVVMDDCPDYPAVFLGAIRIGAVPIPVNPLYDAEQYAFF